MNPRIVTLGFLLVVLLATIAPVSARIKAIDRGGTYVGDRIVQPQEVVDGDINVLFGDLTVEGTVNGDINVVGGDVIPEPGSTITGQVNKVGGDYVRSFAPWIPAMGTSALLAQNHHLMRRLAYSVVVLLFFLLFPMRVRVALERVEQHPGLSAAVGTMAFVAILPIMVLLVLSIVGIPLIALELAALFAGIFIGQAALSLLIGRRLYELIIPHTTPSPLGALVLGLVVVSAAEVVPVMGGLVTAVVWLVGLGAAVLAFVREAHFQPTRGSISGPPMKPA